MRSAVFCPVREAGAPGATSAMEHAATVLARLLIFVKAMILGGLLFLLPIGIVIVVLGKFLAISRNLGKIAHERLLPNTDSYLTPLLFAIAPWPRAGGQIEGTAGLESCAPDLPVAGSIGRVDQAALIVDAWTILSAWNFRSWRGCRGVFRRSPRCAHRAGSEAWRITGS